MSEQTFRFFTFSPFDPERKGRNVPSLNLYLCDRKAKRTALFSIMERDCLKSVFKCFEADVFFFFFASWNRVSKEHSALNINRRK